MKRIYLGAIIILVILVAIAIAAVGSAEGDELELWRSESNAREATWAYIGETSVALMFFPAQNATDVSVDVTDCPMFTSELHTTVPRIDSNVRWYQELFFDIGVEPGDYTIKIAVTYTDDLGGTVEHAIDHPFEVIRAIEVRSLTVSDDKWNDIRVEIETFVFLETLGVAFDATPYLELMDPQETRYDVDPGVYTFSTHPRINRFEGDYYVLVRLGGTANYHSFTVLNQTVKLTIEEDTDYTDYFEPVLWIGAGALLIGVFIISKRRRKSTRQ